MRIIKDFMTCLRQHISPRWTILLLNLTGFILNSYDFIRKLLCTAILLILKGLDELHQKLCRTLKSVDGIPGYQIVFNFTTQSTTGICSRYCIIDQPGRELGNISIIKLFRNSLNYFELLLHTSWSTFISLLPNQLIQLPNPRLSLAL